MNRLRCAIYTRQSTVGAQVDASCATQFETCLNFVKSMRLIGWEWIGERYDDPGYSGATLDRPALTTLLERINAGEVDVLVVEFLDRLSRNVLDTLALLQTFREHRVEVHIVSMPHVPLPSGDNFLINLLASFAEFERNVISERIREARAMLKGHGRRVGGAIPYGYDADPFTKQLLINKTEAEHVRAMFDMAAGGVPPSQIAEYANEKGWRTKRRVARRTGHASGGNTWTARQVLVTLSNATYLGKVSHDGRLRAGVHERIVSDALFAQARQVLESRRTRIPGRMDRGNRWPLKGRIRCAQCGRLMTSHTTRHDNRVYRYYRCRSQAGGNRPCEATQVPAYEIERFVIGSIALAPEAETPQATLLRKFAEAWKLLSEDTQRALVGGLVSEVLCDARGGNLSITFHQDALENYGRNGSER